VDKKQLAKWYSLAADNYDNWGFLEGEECVGDGIAEFENFVSLCNYKTGEKTLDIGCGTGRVMLSFNGNFVVGIDFSARMLALCRQKGGCLLILADAEYLPIRNSVFDLVTCMGLFEYYPLEIADKILAEIARVVKVSGRVVVDFPNSQVEDSYKLKLLEEKAGNQIFIHEKEEILKTIWKYFTVKKENFVSNEIQFILYPKNKK